MCPDRGAGGPGDRDLRLEVPLPYAATEACGERYAKAGMLRVIESVESNYAVTPFEGYTFEQILHMLQKDEAQVLTDPDTSEKGVYIPTPRQKPGAKKIAAMTPTRDRRRVVTYGCD